MRIGFDAALLQPATRYTGMGEYAARLLRAMARVAPEHEFVVFGRQGIARPAEVLAPMAWRPVWTPRAGKFAELLATQALPFAAWRERVDVLHIPGVATRASMPGVPWWSPCPLIVTMHDAIPLTMRMPPKMRVGFGASLRAVRRAARVITVSAAACDEIARLAGVESERIRVVHNGIDFVPDDWERDAETSMQWPRPYALFAGSYEPRKNLGGMLEAYALARGADCDLALVAIVEAVSGHAAAAHARARSLGLDGHVRFVHGLSQRDIVGLYAGARMLVFPSLAEGFGFPPLQAMQCGTPVIASDIEVLRETLGDAAMFIDPRDPASIAGAMRRVDGDAALRACLAEKGRERAARFRWDDAARKTIATYVECVA